MDTVIEYGTVASATGWQSKAPLLPTSSSERAPLGPGIILPSQLEIMQITLTFLGGSIPKTQYGSGSFRKTSNLNGLISANSIFSPELG